MIIGVEIEFPDPGESKDVPDLFSQFQCQHSCSYNYSMSLVKPCGRAITHAHTSKIRINESGLLSIQHSIPVRGKQQQLVNWVEFLVLSSVDSDDHQPIV